MSNNPDLASILKETHTIAVVGLSSNPEKPSHEVARYLKENGYRIIPVNPAEEEVLGERSYATVSAVPEKIDLVNVFRHPARTPEVAQDAVRAGAKVLWLQQGIKNPETRRIAEEGGLIYIEDECTRLVHETLLTAT